MRGVRLDHLRLNQVGGDIDSMEQMEACSWSMARGVIGKVG
jgi:hypothetical protein